MSNSPEQPSFTTVSRSWRGYYTHRDFSTVEEWRAWVAEYDDDTDWSICTNHPGNVMMVYRRGKGFADSLLIECLVD